MINIYQFLKQGTSLSTQTRETNHRLTRAIIPNHPQPNNTYQQSGKFHDSDSQQLENPDTYDAQQINNFTQQVRKQNKLLLKKQNIKIQGLDAPHALSNFSKMIKKYEIKEELVGGLSELGYECPTAVQMQVIPCLLENRSIVVTAPTGTGKTLSFLLPVANQIQASNKIQGVIMAPSQELAAQITQVISILFKNTNITYKCVSNFSEEQLNRINAKKSPNINIVIATPLTFLKIFQKRRFLLKHTKYVVIDECDKCFQQSFFLQMKSFLDLFEKYFPTYALFSATIQYPVEQILKEYLHDCLRIQVGGRNKVLHKINQSIQYCTNQLGKLVYLKNLISQGNLVPPVLIFVQQKQRTKQLLFELKKFLQQQMRDSKRVEVLTSDKSKQIRKKILQQFDSGKYWILITTDIVARGIDFKNVNFVINYDFPNSMLNYIHRVGRTGRADKAGTAITFFTDQDKPLVRSLANLLKVSKCSVPDWICEMPQIKRKQKRKLEKYPVRRLSVGRSSGIDKQWAKDVQILQKRWMKLKKRQIQKGKQRQQKGNDDGWTTVKAE